MSYTLTRLTLKTRLEPRDVSVLTHADAALKLSLYLPFDRSWRESQEGKVLLRDLRRRAAADLERRGALSGGVDAVLSPIDSLLAEPDASRFDGEGLALFDRAVKLAPANVAVHYQIALSLSGYNPDRFAPRLAAELEAALHDAPQTAYEKAIQARAGELLALLRRNDRLGFDTRVRKYQGYR